METTELIGSQWEYVLDMLPQDLESSARAKLAIQRRRGIEYASDLVRVILAYSVCDFSLRDLALWASTRGLGDLSAPALGKRLAKAADWVSYLVFSWLRDHGLNDQTPAVAVRVIDATVISKPGSRGTDWRIHLGLDLASERITSVEVTGPEGGETLVRHDVPAGQIILGDRGYAHRAGVAHALQAQDHVVLRINWQNFPLATRSGEPVDLVARSLSLSEGQIADWPVQFEEQGQTYQMRVVAIRKSAAAAEAEQRRVIKLARRKKREPDPRSLEAAHFIYLLTDLPPHRLRPKQALELYRLRWQIEIAFKRLKGLLDLDHLRARSPEAAATYLYGKLLGALLLDQLYTYAESFFPWGFPLLHKTTEPLAVDEPVA